jgi:LmbE family N-acetylglucosaminyl deacetylase
MKFNSKTAEVYIPNGLPLEQALARTTHLCIAAHQDDIEIMAAQPILACFHQAEKAFTGVVVTDGRGSPRDGLYKEYTDEAMRLVRFGEQRKAADVGEYAAQVLLDYPSKMVKDPTRNELVEDLITLLRATKPKVVYTHNLADKHDTHVAVSLRLIQALRHLEPAERPAQVIGCEIWRSLDWMVDSEKFVMDVSEHQNLQAALLGVFDSQIAGGKRYDAAALSRRLANATFFESHAVDKSNGLIFGMDLTPLIQDLSLDISSYVLEYINHFSQDVTSRIGRLSASANSSAER